MTDHLDAISRELREHRDAKAALGFMINTGWLALVSTPILLGLILWRVW